MCSATRKTIYLSRASQRNTSQPQLHHHFQQSRPDYAQRSKAFPSFFFSVNPRLFYFIMPKLHGLPLLYPGSLGINRRTHKVRGGTNASDSRF